VLHCAHLADVCCACCGGCSNGLRMQTTAAYSHRTDKVSMGVPLLPTGAKAAQDGPLSPAAMLVCCSA
jgi:hypothetical protein